MVTIKLPPRFTANEWAEMVSIHESINSCTVPPTIDASATTRISPLGVCILAASIAKMPNEISNNINIIHPDDDFCDEFLIETGFYDLISKIVKNNSKACHHDSNTLKVQQLFRRDPVYIANLSKLLNWVPGANEEAEFLVHQCLNELIENVFDHASSPSGCFVLARYFKEYQNVKIAVVDGGAGIPGVIKRERPDLRECADKDLLKKAMSEGFTTRTQTHGGRGLKTTKVITTHRDGGLIILSGSGKYEAKAHNENFKSIYNSHNDGNKSCFYGTAIEIDFRPHKLVHSVVEEVF